MFFSPTPLLSDDYENTALFPPPSNHIRDIPRGSADPIWQHSGVQDSPVAAVVPLCGGAFSSSSSQSSISEQGPGLIPHQERRHDRQPMKHFGELMSSCRKEKMHNESTTTLECFIKPTEPSFNQERNYLHAMEVSVLLGWIRNSPPQRSVIGLCWTCQSSRSMLYYV